MKLFKFIEGCKEAYCHEELNEGGVCWVIHAMGFEARQSFEGRYQRIAFKESRSLRGFDNRSLYWLGYRDCPKALRRRKQYIIRFMFWSIFTLRYRSY